MNPQPASAAPQASSTGALVFSWLFVGLPLAWGVTQTFLKALTLFK